MAGCANQILAPGNWWPSGTQQRLEAATAKMQTKTTQTMVLKGTGIRLYRTPVKPEKSI
jgi:hypothetical protein